jgi:hypothetical protein
MLLAQKTYHHASKIGLKQILMMTTQEGGAEINVAAGDDRTAVHLQVLPQVMWILWLGHRYQYPDPMGIQRHS